VERLVFVKHDALRVFVGIATPKSVRRVLGERFPSLEAAFVALFANVAPHTAAHKQQEVQTIGFGWPSLMFAQDGVLIQEQQFRQKISAATLCEWLGPELQTETRQWSGGPPGKRLYAKILSCEALCPAADRPPARQSRRSQSTRGASRHCCHHVRAAAGQFQFPGRTSAQLQRRDQ
jgi:hypothetical protein